MDDRAKLQPILNAIACFVATFINVIANADEPAIQKQLRAPDGFSISLAANISLVERPMFIAQDDHGGLYVLDSGGVNGNGRDQNPPDVIRYLTDTDGDQIYDKSIVFADQIVFGTGLAFYDNAVYVTSPPSLWKLEDLSGDGIADQRTELLTGFAFNQSCTDDLHGACFGPDGRLYFLPGRFEHKIRRPNGPLIRQGIGPWLMRCRPDGRDVEFVSGAVGNPVEVTFLPNGDAFVQGTFWAKPSMGDGLRDALVHAIGGAEYSIRDRDYGDRIRTGEFLPALVPFSATAPSGLTAYTSDVFGKDFQSNLFTSHFNTGKILRHRLDANGGTYTSHTENFVVAAQGDVHFTDVLEAADGSLLVVDTGGWYRACCPASGTSKPEVKGAIYRVRHAHAENQKDPYGNGINWNSITADGLAKLLNDPRNAVRERAILALSKRGTTAVAVLSNVLDLGSTPVLQRRNAVWTLCRMDEPSAREAASVALRDVDDEVRQIAAQVAGLHRDKASLHQLIELLEDKSLPVRREAANALGRIGHAEAVPSLLAAVGSLSNTPHETSNRFVEHALIYALIAIGDAASLRKGLQFDGTAQRRAALLALDQMPEEQLRVSDIGPLLAVKDAALQKAAIDILAKHPEWVEKSVNLIDGWLQQQDLTSEQSETLSSIVQSLIHEGPMQQLLGKHLANQHSLSISSMKALLHAIAHSGATHAAPQWRDNIAIALRNENSEIKQAALCLVERLSVAELSTDVHSIARDERLAAKVRLAALRSLAIMKQALADDEFDYIFSQLSPKTLVQERLLACDVLVHANLSESRQRRLLGVLRTAGPIELPLLLQAFRNNSNDALGLEIIHELTALDANPSPDIIEPILQQYGTDIRVAAEPLLKRLRNQNQNQIAKVTELESVVQHHDGNAQRGRETFFGKAQCHLCHTVTGQGGKVGPDLSAIGSIRSRRDLLEAIAFPSASFARGYEPILVVMDNGQVKAGMAGRETTNELILNVIQNNQQVEVVIHRDQIDEVKMGTVSAMPNGLDLQLKPQELTDLICFLEQLRR